MDPAVVLPSNSEISYLSEFWVRLTEWERDTRVSLGPATRDALSLFYSIDVCGNQNGEWIPHGMSKSVHRTIINLLNRRPIPGSESKASRTLSPAYTSTSSKFPNRDLFHDDLAVSVYQNEARIATAHESWPSNVNEVSVTPSPPMKLVLHREPNTPTAEDLAEEFRIKYAPYKFLIIGGQAEARILDHISDRFGIDRSRIDWLPSEKSKPPRGVDAKIRGFSTSKGCIICITGKIGHATWLSMKSKCATLGVPLTSVETIGDMVTAFALSGEGGVRLDP